MKFYIYTLGCKVNTYESQVIEDMLIKKGYVLSNEEDADIYIINTCSVTNTADNKSLKMVRRFKRLNPNAIIVVMGCMTQANPDILDDLGVSIILGNKYKNDVPLLIEEFIKTGKPIKKIENIRKTDFEEMKLNNFNLTRAFVKIEDGCDNFCSFCIIPYTRGGVRSRNFLDIINEVRLLVSEGHKEIVLTGIHTGHYNDGDHTFSNLLEYLSEITGLERIRISSIEITELNEDFMNILKKSNVIVDHIHIPLQSGSNLILKLMNRKYDKEYFINKINEIRSIRPDISITTDVIVGFPSETDELFEETIDTIKKVNFSKLHVFPFSLRRGTKAEVIPNHVDEVTKKKRTKTLIELSKKLEIDYMNKFIGKKVIFIPEVYKDGYLIGHTGNYLLVKYKGMEDLLNKDVLVEIKSVEYPYVIGE